jgi:hypothetical protein
LPQATEDMNSIQLYIQQKNGFLYLNMEEPHTKGIHFKLNNAHENLNLALFRTLKMKRLTDR